MFRPDSFSVSFICSIIFHYLSLLFFHFMIFYFIFLFLICLPRDTFYKLTILFKLISLQPALDCSISLQYTIQKTFIKLQTTCKTRKEMMRKNCYNLFKKHFLVSNFYHISKLQIHYW